MTPTDAAHLNTLVRAFNDVKASALTYRTVITATGEREPALHEHFGAMLMDLAEPLTALSNVLPALTRSARDSDAHDAVAAAVACRCSLEELLCAISDWASADDTASGVVTLILRLLEQVTTDANVYVMRLHAHVTRPAA